MSATLPSTASPFEVRRAGFADTMDFYAPGLKRWQTSEWQPSNPRRFLPVSVTGSACALSCDHCQSKVLEGMVSVRAEEDLFALASRLQAQGSQGLLVSGGSTRAGGVPLLPHLRHVPRIREELGMKVIVHSGVVSPELADGLAEAGVDGVMLDVIGAEETIREVYHLDLTVADFDRALGLLAGQGLRIIPHIVLGLHYGQFLGEHRALEIVAEHQVSTIILVVLVPLVGTPMAHLPPPPVDDVVDFFAAARLAAPRIPVNLGCARPLGSMKTDLDQAAIDLGLNGIAYPADGAIGYAEARGLDPAAVRVLLLADLDRGRRGRLRPGGDGMSEHLGPPGGCSSTTRRRRGRGLALDEALMAAQRPRRTGRPGHAAAVHLPRPRGAGRALPAPGGRGGPATRVPATGTAGEPPADRRRGDHHGAGAARRGAGHAGARQAAHPRRSSPSWAEGVVAGLAELGISAELRAARTTSWSAAARSPGSGSTSTTRGGDALPRQRAGRPRHRLHAQVLAIPAAKLGDKGVAAVAERVTTVSPRDRAPARAAPACGPAIADRVRRAVRGGPGPRTSLTKPSASPAGGWPPSATARRRLARGQTAAIPDGSGSAHAAHPDGLAPGVPGDARRPGQERAVHR